MTHLSFTHTGFLLRISIDKQLQIPPGQSPEGMKKAISFRSCAAAHRKAAPAYAGSYPQILQVLAKRDIHHRLLGSRDIKNKQAACCLAQIQQQIYAIPLFRMQTQSFCTGKYPLRPERQFLHALIIQAGILLQLTGIISFAALKHTLRLYACLPGLRNPEFTDRSGGQNGSLIDHRSAIP